ncbi:hypothetical protein DB44_CW00870 [Candidatus Protochlamydia amoebophila]|uniref:Uncharacterized protein n=1 Tax=Candidatus Protochlamydia amoebophila TaxID=362787 RepID=A0A0C1H2N8_9BACT|nr:hypothetical protein DB44_CW00870 [Candidatus Protochlamydia amoebophila]
MISFLKPLNRYQYVWFEMNPGKKCLSREQVRKRLLQPIFIGNMIYLEHFRILKCGSW